MTRLFDGMSSVANGVFGGAVTVYPDGGSAVVVQAKFRADPQRIVDSEGFDVLIVAPTLRLPASLVPGLTKGDRVEPSNGRTYRVANTHPTGSPAADGGVIHELEEVDPT